MTRTDRQARQIVQQRRALELRERGTGYREIAQELGCSIATAHSAVDKALKRVLEPAANSIRALEASRLDKAQGAIWDKVLAGDLDAISAFLRISARRSALLGLDAATRVEIVGGALDQLVRSLGLSVELVAEVIRQAAGAMPEPSRALAEAIDVTPREAPVMANEDEGEDDEDAEEGDDVLDLTAGLPDPPRDRLNSLLD